MTPSLFAGRCVNIRCDARWCNSLDVARSAVRHRSRQGNPGSLVTMGAATIHRGKFFTSVNSGGASGSLTPTAVGSCGTMLSRMVYQQSLPSLP